MSHRRRVWSHEPDRAKWPSLERTTSETKCPSPVSFQTIRDLSREDDRIMSGYLGLVAIWVTHPLWPSRVPRRLRFSLMLRWGVRWSVTAGKAPKFRGAKNSQATGDNVFRKEPH